MIRERFFAGASLEEVAVGMNITRERVRQIEAQALRKLRHPSRTAALVGIANEIEGTADA